MRPAVRVRPRVPFPSQDSTMTCVVQASPSLRYLVLTIGLCSVAACASSGSGNMSTVAPNPDPRVGLRAGLMDAGEASWNLRVVSRTPPPAQFARITNSDLAFTGQYAIQGNYNGFQVWDISNPAKPTLKVGFVCPASQSDVSVYKNLLFVSGEGMGGRLDCGKEGVHDSVSASRLRGIRIFDISDIAHPRYIANVQTCRGSHTQTVVVAPNDQDNVYVYVSGSAPVRSPSELPGCVAAPPDSNPNSALFRIEVIKVPLAHPEQAAIVSSPRIFSGLAAPPKHGEMPEDIAAAAKEAADWRAKGGFTAKMGEIEYVLEAEYTKPMLDSVVKARGGTPGGRPTAADSAGVRAAIQKVMDDMMAPPPGTVNGVRPGPSQCHDITVYPAMGWRAARAAATGCCWTSATRPTRSASTPCPTRTSRTG